MGFPRDRVVQVLMQTSNIDHATNLLLEQMANAESDLFLEQMERAQSSDDSEQEEQSYLMSLD